MADRLTKIDEMGDDVVSHQENEETLQSKKTYSSFLLMFQAASICLSSRMLVYLEVLHYYY